jgi:fatty acid-binding protein DegV
LVTSQCPRSPEAQLSVMHADVPQAAQALAEELCSALNLSGLPIYTVSASITTHGGPGILAAGFFVP